MAIRPDYKELFRRLKPVDVPAIPCTECEPSIDGKQVTHEPMCPIAICIEDATDADRIWFETHPFVDHYYREITWGEGAQLLLHDDKAQGLAQKHDLEVVGRVRVNFVREGLRTRNFEDVYFVVVDVHDLE